MIDQKNFLSRFSFTVLLFTVIFTAEQTYAQCPTVAAPNQAFCDADNPRVIDLVATDQGDGVAWYADLIGGVPLTSNIILQDGETYYADSASETCLIRPSVTVSISGEPPTNVDVAVSRCSSDINTINQLNADGTNIQWYDAQNGGSILPGTTELITGVTYWVEQTEGVCTSIRLPTTVTIIDPGEPTGEPEQFFCFDPANPIVFQVADLSAVGDNITWYRTPTATSPLDPSTPLVNNRTYYATQTTFPCESSGRFATVARIETLPDPGSDNSINLCDSSMANIDLINQLGGTPDNGGTWTGPFATTNGDQGTLDTSLLDVGSYSFTYTLAAQVSCPEVSSIVTINVQDLPEAGEDGVLEICTNEPSVDLFGLLGGTPDTGGTWSPALDSGTNIFNPAIDTSGTYTYTVAPAAPCTVSDTATITVTVEQAPVAGPDVSTTLCSSDPALDLFTLLTGADAGGTWSPALTSGTGVFDPAVDIAGAYTYTLDPTATCPGDESIVTVSIIPQPVAGDDAATEICSNDAPIDLFTIIGGTPDAGGTWSPALASGTGVFDPAVDPDGNYTYTVAPTAPCTVSDTATISVTIEQAPDPGLDGTANYCDTDPSVDLFSLLGGTPNAGGTWSPTLASGTGVFNPAVDPSGVYTYTIAATAVCGSVESMVNVTVSPQPFAGDDSSIELCTNDATVDLFTVLGGAPDTGGTWSPALASGTGIYDPAVDAGVVYTYMVPALGTCPADDATVSVTLNILPNAGANATSTVCGDDTAYDLFPLLGASANPGGTWSGPSNLTNGDTGTFDPAINVSGDYVYTSAGSGACEDVSATVQVTVVNPTPTLPTDGEIFCIADSPLISDLIARVIPEMAGTIQVYSTPTGTVPLVDTEALVAGDTYYITETDVPTSCEGTNRLVVTIQINDPQIPTLSNASAEFCLIDDPTVSDLSAFITTGSNVVWVDAISNGNQFSETDALVTGDYYAIEEDINTCRSATSTVLSIIINDNPAPTLNPNGNELCGVEMPTIAELEANLTIETGLTVVWYDMNEGGNLLSTTDILIDNTNYYAATFNATTGCESNERLEITVDLTACDLNQYPLLLPDGFSPNGDGINDTYDLQNVQFLYENYTIEIYNRYGNLLFMGNNSTAPWDGTSNQAGTSGDKLVPNGVYFYIFNYNRNNVQPKQGRIYLNR
ncbi:MAG: gliding motility-associated C-terminal domain-containing protein [Maribacter sp.]